MGFFSQFTNVLQQYQGASAATPPPNVEEDFRQVAPQVGQGAISSGLSDAFRSHETAPFGQMVSQMFAQSNGEQRAGILNHLIPAVGSAGLAGGLMGGLSSLLQGRSSVTPAEAQNVSPEAVQQMAEHAEKKDPSIVDTASQFYAQHPTLVQGLGAGALALIMSRMSQHS